MSTDDLSSQDFKQLDWGTLFYRYRYYILIILVGLIFLGAGIMVYQNQYLGESTKIEIIKEEEEVNEIVVEIAGEVEKPGVYRLVSSARTEDLLTKAGGVSVGADREWMQKYLNRAAKLTDGQKIFIPKKTAENQQSAVLSASINPGDQTVSEVLVSQGSGLININTASLSQLDSLPGIGPVYGQNIIDHRPYSNIEELTQKEVLKKSVYEKIKDKISVY